MKRILLCLLFVTDSVFAMTEKEAEHKYKLAEIAYKCAAYNQWALDFNEADRLSLVGLDSLLQVSPLMLDKFKLDIEKENSKGRKFTPEQYKLLNKDFILGMIVGTIGEQQSNTAGKDVYRDFPRSSTQDTAKNLIIENNCNFIK
ncbi:exported hypothetical protein [Moraxellaceae bacterium 17A]|nr:exported hypothetical protein [Moraxellaceae bacterium 17A]